MLQLLILLGLLAPQPPKATAQVQTCQWPHVCAKPPVVQVAQVQPCVWPNRCEIQPNL